MPTPDRWAPWGEQIAQTANVTINSTTAATLTGASRSFTPHVNARLIFTLAADIECSVLAAGSILNIRASIGPSASPGTPNPRTIVLLPTAAGLRSNQAVGGFWDLVKETTYTITLEGLLLVAGGSSYIVRGAALTFTALPNLHA